NAGFVFRLGLVRERKKDSTAIDLFFKTIALESTHQGALYKTSKHHLQNGQHFNAIKLSSTGLEKRPDNISLLSILGQAYSVSLQFDKAIPVYEKIINLGKGSEFILEKLAKAYRLNAQPKQAIETYKKMLDFNDMNSAVHSNLGTLYLITDEVDKAQLHFTMALLIKKQPLDNEYLNIGLTFKKQGEFEKAFQNFEKAIEDNPKNERAILERAIAADAFMKDKESILNLYQAYYNKYKNSGRNDMLSIAEYRIGLLKGEIHQSK
ncbi:tetratricopeptide repeat protein, partial [Christiangramia aquimixticola]|uniref:tetratricopeptide repeat protein n=1 Tax=Christiangramia aquimixticola TaxID=1697558 RepID=UPI003AA82383